MSELRWERGGTWRRHSHKLSGLWYDERGSCFDVALLAAGLVAVKNMSGKRVGSGDVTAPGRMFVQFDGKAGDAVISADGQTLGWSRGGIWTRTPLVRKAVVVGAVRDDGESKRDKAGWCDWRCCLTCCCFLLLFLIGLAFIWLGTHPPWAQLKTGGEVQESWSTRIPSVIHG